MPIVFFTCTFSELAFEYQTYSRPCIMYLIIETVLLPVFCRHLLFVFITVTRVVLFPSTY